MSEKHLQRLKIWDWLLLTILLFGQPILSSTLIFIRSKGQGMPSLTETTAAVNWYMFGVQGILLLMAMGYLWIRKFDMKQLQFRINWKATAVAVLLFLILAVLMDLFSLVWDPSLLKHLSEGKFYPFWGFWYMFQRFTPSIVFYSLLNGIYEEIYFVGICTVVEEKWLKLTFFLSLLIRIAFHTYQGAFVALGIGVILGCVYYYWYKKRSKNLYPIFLSHALADVLGLGLIRYFFF